MSGRAAEAAAVSALAVILTAGVAAPVLRAPSERIFGMAIVGRHHDPFTVMEQFSRPLRSGLSSQPLTDLPGALLARVAGPVAAYNGIVLITFPLSALAAFLLARYLALPPAAAGLAAAAVAFSPFHLAQAAYHPHIAQTQWIPFYFLALWRCLDRARPADVAILALSAAAVTLSNLYGGLIAAVLTPVAVAAHWGLRSRYDAGALRKLAITTVSLAVLAAAGLAYGSHVGELAYAAGAPRAGTGFARADLFLFSAKWWGYLVPPIAQPWAGRLAERVWAASGVPPAALLEQQVSLGSGLVALAAVAVCAWLARGRSLTTVGLMVGATNWTRVFRSAGPQAPSSGAGVAACAPTQGVHRPALAAVPILAVVAIAALVCSLSPERIIGPVTFTRPSAWLYPLAPLFRAYARFGVVVQLMTALLAGIGAAWLWGMGLRTPRIICAALVTLATAEYAVWPPAMWRDVLPTAAHRWVAGQATAVRVLDCAPLTPESQSVQWLTAYRLVLHTEAFDDCTQPNLADKLAAGGFTHLLVRRRTPEGRRLADQGAVPGFRSAARFGDGEVFLVTAPAPDVFTAAMTGFYAREHAKAWTWRWAGSEGVWTVVNRRPYLVTARLDVELTTFDHPRRVAIMLDGQVVQTLVVAGGRGVSRIGPLVLTPGEHALVFRPEEPAVVADELAGNGDPRPLSVGVGTWHWSVDDGTE